MNEEKYEFKEGDKVRCAIKKKRSIENALYKKVDAVAGENSVEIIFTAEETKNKLEIGEEYILQADLLSNGTFPMFLDTLKVINSAIIEE